MHPALGHSLRERSPSHGAMETFPALNESNEHPM